VQPNETHKAQALQIIERALALVHTAQVPPEARSGWVNAFAEMLAAIDPDRAFSLVEPTGDKESDTDVLERLSARAMVAFPTRAPEFVHLAGGGGWRTSVALGAAAKADPGNALKAARAFGDTGWRVDALCQVAAAIAGNDPQQSNEIIREALQVARSAATHQLHQIMATSIINALRLVDREAALRIALESGSFWTVLSVAAAFIRYEPDRAPAVLQMAEAAAKEEYPMQPDWVRVAIAKAWAGVDAKRAVDLARAIEEDGLKVRTLSWILPYLETVAPDQARSLAEELLAFSGRVYIPGIEWWETVIPVVARLNPKRRLELAAKACNESLRDVLLFQAVRELASDDVQRAMELAATILPASERDSAIAGIAGALAPYDPDRALNLASQIEYWPDRASAIGNVIRELIAADPERALHTAERLRGDLAAAQFQDFMIEIAQAMGQRGCREKAIQLLVPVLRDRDSYARNEQIAEEYAWQILARIDAETSVDEALKLNDANLALGTMLEATRNLLGLHSFDDEEADEFTPWPPLA